MDGLKTLGILQLMQQHPQLFRPLLQSATKPLVTSSQMLKLFQPVWSPNRSNQREKEELIILNWTTYLDETQGMFVYWLYNGLFFMYHSLEYIIFTSCTLRPLHRVISYCNVGWCVKGSAVHCSCQQSLVARWLGLSATVKVRVRARARECGFSFFPCVKVTNTFVLHVIYNTSNLKLSPWTSFELVEGCLTYNGLNDC